MADRVIGVIANLDRFLDVVEGMDMGPLNHFSCTEVEALADLMTAQRGEEAGLQVIIHHFFETDEETGELMDHLEKWPELAGEIRRQFSDDYEIQLTLTEALDELEQEKGLRT